MLTGNQQDYIGEDRHTGLRYLGTSVSYPWGDWSILFGLEDRIDDVVNRVSNFTLGRDYAIHE